MKQGLFLLIMWTLPQLVFAAGGNGWHLDESPHNLRDQLSLQRGAQVYVNYCQGCHSAKFIRFNRFAKDAGITDRDGNVLEAVLKENLMFLTENVGDPMTNAMTAKDAKKWFGKQPPDLSLIARRRGADWLYTYMRTFYVDDVKTMGVNNAVFPDVGMPHVLMELQGVQKPVYKTVTKEVQGQTTEIAVLDKLELVEPGTLTESEYNRLVADLVNFLVYIGEPMKLERQRIGVWVILFIIVFGFFAYLLKREYWKDVH